MKRFVVLLMTILAVATMLTSCDPDEGPNGTTPPTTVGQQTITEPGPPATLD